MLFSFVILHYKTLNDTIECIESIKRINTRHDYCIVVVDNNSDNGSYESLLHHYGQDDSIHFLHNESNLGFARGNNVGYQFAKSLHSDYIAVLNNDIIIQSEDIVDRIISAHETYDFSLLGPDIISLVDHGHQNPMETTTTDLLALRKRIWRYKLLRLVNKTPFYDVLRGKGNHHNDDKREKNINYLTNIQLHGSFIVYSPNYINQEKYAFCPETFLYTEEPILYQYCMRKGYATLYCPDVRVYHKEDSSTNSLYIDDKEKRDFVFRNLISSHRIYYRHLKKSINDWD